MVVPRSEQGVAVDVGGLAFAVEEKLQGLAVGALDQPAVAAAGFKAAAPRDACLFVFIQPGNTSQGILPATDDTNVS